MLGPAPSIAVRADLAKDEPERHFVYQCFQYARTCVRAGKIRMRPSPEVTMPAPTVMALNSEPKGLPSKLRSSSVIFLEKITSECGVRENPIQPLLLKVARNAERHCRSHEIACPSTSNVPRQEPSPISLLPIRKWNGFAFWRWDPNLPKAFPERSFAAFRSSETTLPKPARAFHPDRLRNHPPRIHEQISEPPRPATVRKSETKKPDFVTAPGGER
jgi:hypothetical protein